MCMTGHGPADSAPKRAIGPAREFYQYSSRIRAEVALKPAISGPNLAPTRPNFVELADVGFIMNNIGSHPVNQRTSFRNFP